MWKSDNSNSTDESALFFYITLRQGTPEDIQRMFSTLRGDIERTVDSILELCWFMRGSIGYEEMMLRTSGERQRIGKFIERRLESQKNSFNPVY